METLFKALADATRLRILGLLLTGEVCVCHIHESLKIPQPKASRHLAYLRRAGLVETRRDGLWIHYRLGDARRSGAGRDQRRRPPRAHPHRRRASRRASGCRSGPAAACPRPAMSPASAVLRADAFRPQAGDSVEARIERALTATPRRARLLARESSSRSTACSSISPRRSSRGRTASVVGSAALEVYPDGALLRSVAVAPRAQGHGLGHGLTDAAHSSGAGSSAARPSTC